MKPGRQLLLPLADSQGHKGSRSDWAPKWKGYNVPSCDSTFSKLAKQRQALIACPAPIFPYGTSV